jgi:hypothetical protein
MYLKDGHRARVWCPEVFCSYDTKDCEGLAGCRECGEGARGVVRGEGDNVGIGILPRLFFNS